MYCLKVPYRHNARPWVARILGKCKTYGLQREFVPMLKDYRSSDIGEQEVVQCFFLEQGEAYEVCENPDDKESRYYCRITARNDLERLPLEEVMAAVSVMAKIESETRPAPVKEQRPKVVPLSSRIYGGYR